MSVGITAILVGEEAEFYRTIDFVLQETIRRNGIPPELLVLV